MIIVGLIAIVIFCLAVSKHREERRTQLGKPQQTEGARELLSDIAGGASRLGREVAEGAEKLNKFVVQAKAIQGALSAPQSAAKIELNIIDSALSLATSRRDIEERKRRDPIFSSAYEQAERSLDEIKSNSSTLTITGLTWREPSFKLNQPVRDFELLQEVQTQLKAARLNREQELDKLCGKLRADSLLADEFWKTLAELKESDLAAFLKTRLEGGKNNDAPHTRRLSPLI